MTDYNRFAKIIKTISTREVLDEVVESIDSINEETLPNKVKKTLNRVRFTLNELK